MDECTLYMTLASAEGFAPLLARHLAGWTIRVDGPRVIAGQGRLFSRREIVFSLESLESGGDEFTEMLLDMYLFFAAIPTERTEIKKLLLTRMLDFTVVVDIASDRDMDDATLGALMAVAAKGHGLVFLPPGDMYTPNGELVLNVDGESDFASSVVPSLFVPLV